MREIPLHSLKYLGLVSSVDDEDFDRVNQYRWNVTADNNGRFYAKARINGEFVLMHRFLLGASPLDPQVDHHDHNGLNNQRHNIRFSSNSQNQANQRPRFSGSSLYKGVNWSKFHKKWHSRGNFKGKKVHLGLFDSEIEAAQAYNVFALEHHGEFAFLNDVSSVS